jgi:hypothetical protein
VIAIVSAVPTRWRKQAEFVDADVMTLNRRGLWLSHAQGTKHAKRIDDRHYAGRFIHHIHNFFVMKYHRRQRGNVPRILKPEHMFEIRPFDVHGDLFTFDEFRELLKAYSCSSDNGTGRWASPDGLWFDLRSGKPVRVCPDEVRLGKGPEAFLRTSCITPSNVI